MDEYELSELISAACANLDVKWHVVAIDEWQTIDFSSLPVLIITNTAKRSDKGIFHWLAWAIFKERKAFNQGEVFKQEDVLNIELFDPLALGLHEYGIAPQFSINSQSQRAIQSQNSYSCGIFCVNYAFFRFRKHSLFEIENKIFNPQTIESNEKKAHCIVQKIRTRSKFIRRKQDKQLLKSSSGAEIINACKNNTDCLQTKISISEISACMRHF